MASYHRSECEKHRPKSIIRPRINGARQLIDDLRTARSLGISYKRYQGWEPTWQVEYDDNNRITRISKESEWDDTERAWMRALTDYEHNLCPTCGLPVDECSNPDAEFNLTAEPHICWGRAHQIQAVRQWQQDHPTSPWANALTVNLYHNQ